MSEPPISWRRIGRTSPQGALDFRPRRRAARPVSAADELGAVLGDPQAVVRILSFRRGAAAVLRTARYIAAKAEGALLVEGGAELAPGTLADMVDDWSRDFACRVNGRDAMHLEVSAPPGMDRAALRAAAERFAQRVFGDRQYLLAEHRDRPHPHCHLLVKLGSARGRALDPRKADLARWREAFAAAARAEGLALAASSCRDRGVRARGVSRAAYAQRAVGRAGEIEADLER